MIDTFIKQAKEVGDKVENFNLQHNILNNYYYLYINIKGNKLGCCYILFLLVTFLYVIFLVGYYV